MAPASYASLHQAKKQEIRVLTNHDVLVGHDGGSLVVVVLDKHLSRGPHSLGVCVVFLKKTNFKRQIDRFIKLKKANAIMRVGE